MLTAAALGSLLFGIVSLAVPVEGAVLITSRSDGSARTLGLVACAVLFLHLILFAAVALLIAAVCVGRPAASQPGPVRYSAGSKDLGSSAHDPGQQSRP